MVRILLLSYAKKMIKSAVPKLIAISPTVFTLILIVVGLVNAFKVIQDNLISGKDFLQGTLLLVGSWFLATFISTFFFIAFSRRYSYALKFLDILGTYYRTYLSNIGFPGAIGSGLKLKRLSSRTRPDVAISFLFLERMYSLILQSLFIALISIQLLSKTSSDNFSGLPGFIFVTIIFCAFLIAFFPKLLRVSLKMLGWISERLRTNFFREPPTLDLSLSSHLIVFFNVLFPMAARLGAAAFVGELILPGSFLWVLFARSLASLVSMLPLPIATLIAREGAFVASLLLVGYSYELVLTLSASFILSTISNGLIGVLFELPMAARGLKKRLRIEKSEPSSPSLDKKVGLDGD